MDFQCLFSWPTFQYVWRTYCKSVSLCISVCVYVSVRVCVWLYSWITEYSYWKIKNTTFLIPRLSSLECTKTTNLTQLNNESISYLTANITSLSMFSFFPSLVFVKKNRSTMCTRTIKTTFKNPARTNETNNWKKENTIGHSSNWKQI